MLSSPRRRALRTAELAGIAGVEVLEALAEWDLRTGRGSDDPADSGEPARVDGLDAGSRGGETAEDVHRRADRVVATVKAADGPVLAFTHGHFLRVLAARWLGLDVAAGAHFRLSTATVSVLGGERAPPPVVRWNWPSCDLSHAD